MNKYYTNNFYCVYEISNNHRKYGKLMKRFKTKQSAIKYCSKSIYRYILEKDILVMEF